MKKIKSQCELLSTNKNVLNHAFSWNHEMMSIAGASIFTMEEKKVRLETLQFCEDILKKKSVSLRGYMGNVKIPLLCRMALSIDPEQYLMNVEEAYQLLNTKKIFDDDHKIMASMSMCEHVSKEEYSCIISRMKEIHKRMKKEHLLITSSEDIPLAFLLALSNKDIEVLIQDMEACFDILKHQFHNSNVVQTLSHVLALSEESSEEKSTRVIRLFKLLKEKKHEFGTGNELAMVGILSMLELSEEDIAEAFCVADDILLEQKGFGDFLLGPVKRRLFASQIVLSVYKQDIFVLKEASIMVGIGACISSSVSKH